MSVALVTLPVLLSRFGSSVYGSFVLASSLVSLVGLLDLGVGLTTVSRIAAGMERDDRGDVALTVRSALTLYTGLGILAAGVLVVCAVFAESLFAVRGSDASLLRTMLVIHAAAQLVLWPTMVGRQVLAGMQKYPSIVRVTIGITIGHATAIVLVLATDNGPLVLTATQTMVSVIGATVLASAAYRQLPHHRLSGRIDGATLLRFALPGVPLFTIQVASFLMRQQTDRLVLGVFVGATAVAIYEAAAKLSALIGQANELTTSALLPYISGRHAAGDHDSVRTTFLLGTRYVGMTLVPVVMALVALSYPLLRAWVGAQLGSDVSAAARAAQVLLVSHLGLVVYSVADPILIGIGRFHRWTVAAIALALLNLLLSIALVRPFGVVGVATGTLVATLAEAPLFLRLVFRELRVSPGEWFTRTLLPAAAAGAIAFAVGRSWTLLGQPPGLPALAAVFVGSVAAAYLASFAILLSTEERALLRRVVGTR